MQWFQTTKHLNGFVPQGRFSPLNISSKIPEFVIQTPPRIKDSIPFLDPAITIQTKKYSGIFDNVLNNAALVIKTILASNTREVFVCIFCLIIITNESYMKVVTAFPCTYPCTLPPFTNFWMSVFACFFIAFLAPKVGLTSFFWMCTSTLKFILDPC